MPVEGEFQEKTRSPVGRWGRSSRRRWGRELRSRLGGGGRFPGRRQHGCPRGRWAQASLSPVLGRCKVKCHRGATGRGQGGGAGPHPPQEGPRECGGGRAIGRGRCGRRDVEPTRGSGMYHRPSPRLQPGPTPPLTSPPPSPDLCPSSPSSLPPPFSSPPLTPFFEPSLPSLPLLSLL